MGTGEKSRSMELHSCINHMIPFLGSEIIRPIPIIFTDGGLGYPHILNTWVLDGLGQRNWLVFFGKMSNTPFFFLEKNRDGVANSQSCRYGLEDYCVPGLWRCLAVAYPFS